jgi:hypothetical protein
VDAVVVVGLPAEATAAIHKRARPSLQFFLGRINERSDFQVVDPRLGGA